MSDPHAQGRFGQRFPWTVDHVLIADAERITAERIDSVAVFAAYPSLSQKATPRGTLSHGPVVFTPVQYRHQSRSRWSTPLRLVTLVQVNGSLVHWFTLQLLPAMAGSGLF